MRLGVVIREAAANTSFMFLAFVLAFPLLGPVVLWGMRHFFGAFDMLDTLFRAMKG